MANPTTVPDLRLWLKGDAGVTLSGSNVTSVANQAPGFTTETVAQATAAKQPTLLASAINGLPGFVFDGTDDSFSMSGALLDTFRNVGGGTIIVVARVDEPATTGTTTKQRNLVVFSTNASVNSARATLGATEANAAPQNESVRIGGRRLDGDSFDASFTPVDSWPRTVPKVVTGQFDWANAAARTYLDGTLSIEDLAFQTAGLTPDTASLGGTIGTHSNSTGEFFFGVITEILVYRRALSAKERSEVHTYLSDRYGITVSDYLKTLSASDTPTLQVNETVSLDVPVTAADTLGFGVTDSSSVTIVNVASDDLFVGVTEDTTDSMGLVGADTIDSMITESNTTLVSISASDILSLSIADAVESIVILEEKISSDNLNISISDSPLGIDTTFSAIDTIVPVITESYEFATVSVTSDDPALLSLSESIASNVELSASDNAGVTVEDATVSISIQIITDDPVQLSITETSQFSTVEVTSSDNLDISVDELSAVEVTRPGQDTLSISVSETSSITATGEAFVESGDILSTSVEDTSVVIIVITAGDEVVTSITESVSFDTVIVSSNDTLQSNIIDIVDSNLISFSSSDSINISVSGSTSITNVNSGSDSISSSITESIELVKQETANIGPSDDIMGVNVTDTSVTFVSILSEDNISSVISEQTLTEISGLVLKETNDFLNTQISESFAKATSFQVVKVWNGTNWIFGTVKNWNGTSWHIPSVRIWNGQRWI